MDDADLLQAWRAGDAPAGHALFERHFDALFRFFRNKVADDADDLVQDTFLAILRSDRPFRGEASFRSYLFQAARSRLYDRARSWSRQGERVDVTVHSMADLRPGAATALGKRSEERLVLEALRCLPIEQQALLSLHFFEHLTGPELAVVFEVPEGTIRSRLRLARDALGRHLHRLADTPTLLASTVSGLDDWATTAATVFRR